MSMFAALLAVLVAAVSLPVIAEEQRVDIELVLAVDVSSSMSPDELEIQRRGYAQAITSAGFLKAIRQGFTGKAALAYVEWADTETTKVAVPWTLIQNAADAQAFADRLKADFDSRLRRTSISHVISLAAGMFENNGYRGLRRVIDISGDGPNNQGRNVTLARDEALAKGIVINGLPIMTRDRRNGPWNLIDLDQYYLNCVIGGAGSFVVPVLGWDKFESAVQRKLVLELAGRTPTQNPRLHRAAVTGRTAEGYDCLIGEKIWRRTAKTIPD